MLIKDKARKVENTQPKPFVKWAGGKSQLLSEIELAIPVELKSAEFVYIEPFVGGGAVLFWILQKFPNIKKAVINDINTDLINAFFVIRDNVGELIEILWLWEQEYHSLAEQIEVKNNIIIQNVKCLMPEMLLK